MTMTMMKIEKMKMEKILMLDVKNISFCAYSVCYFYCCSLFLGILLNLGLTLTIEKNKNYYVVKNGARARSRNTLKLTLSFFNE